MGEGETAAEGQGSPADPSRWRAVLVTVVFALAAATQGVQFALRGADLRLIHDVAYRSQSLYDPEDGLVFTFLVGFGLDTVTLISMTIAWLLWLDGVSRRAPAALVASAAQRQVPVGAARRFPLPFAALLHLVPFVDVAGPWIVLRTYAGALPARSRRWVAPFSLAWGAAHLASLVALFGVRLLDRQVTCPGMSRPHHRGVNYCWALIRGWLEIGSATLLLATAVLGIALVWAARPTPGGREPGAR